MRDLGVPFLFTYSRMGPPYTLLFQIPDSKQFWRMEVTDALVEYADATTYRRPGQLLCVVRPDQLARDLDVTPGRSIVLPALGCEIDDLVLRPVSAKVTLTGWLEKKGGERVDFSWSPSFVARPSLLVAPGVWACMHI